MIEQLYRSGHVFHFGTHSEAAASSIVLDSGTGLATIVGDVEPDLRRRRHRGRSHAVSPEERAAPVKHNGQRPVMTGSEVFWQERAI
jgi:hypothetical protein